MVDYGSSEIGNILEDPTIGTLKMYYKSWGVHSDDFKIIFEEVNTTACNKSDFNDVEGSNSESKFFKTGVNSQ